MGTGIYKRLGTGKYIRQDKPPQPSRRKDSQYRQNQDRQDCQSNKKNAKAVPHRYCLNREWGCTWKSPTDNAITTKTEAKKQALEHFDTCLFNKSVTRETAH